VGATWIVAANLSEVQPDKLRRLETWLVNAGAEAGRHVETPSSSHAPNDDQSALSKDPPRVAVLIDFVPVSGGAFGFPFEPGECIAGEVVFYPSAAPLRGLLAARKPAQAAQWPRSPRGLGPALTEFARRLGALPWLESWPLMMDGVSIRTAGNGALAVADDHGRAILVAPGQVEALTPMLGLDGLSLLCLWDGRTAQVLAADTPIGRWHGS
jgi:hypothetical protein